MRLLTIAPDRAAIGHFANDAIKREMKGVEVGDLPVSAEDLLLGIDIELEILRGEKTPDVIVIWHWGKTELAPWANPLFRLIRQEAPKSYLVWVMFGMGTKEELAHFDKPEEGSFVIDYGDPSDSLMRYFREKEKSGLKTSSEEAIMAVIDAGDEYSAFLACLRAITG